MDGRGYLIMCLSQTRTWLTLDSIAP